MALRELDHLGHRCDQAGKPCEPCKGVGGVTPPKNYQDTWGKSLINGLLVCHDCDGTGVHAGRSK